MRDIINIKNLCISWRSYASPSFFYYHRYHIHHQNGDDYFLFIGPLQFRWWKMKDYSRMISRLDYFKAMETYNKMAEKLRLEAPDFRLFVSPVPKVDRQPIPFRAISESELIELTPEGYQHYKMLSNQHATTLLAVWIIKHANH